MMTPDYNFGIVTMDCDNCSHSDNFEDPCFEGGSMDAHRFIDFKGISKQARGYGWEIWNHQGEWMHCCSTECRDEVLTRIKE